MNVFKMNECTGQIGHRGWGREVRPRTASYAYNAIGGNIQRGTGPIAGRFFACLIAALLLFTAPLGTAALAKTVRLVALGDSLTAGYGLDGPDAFPEKLQRALRAKGYDVEVRNAGVSGDTASDGLQRLDWALNGKPDGLILELGANDALRAIDPAVTRKALDGILTRLSRRNIPVLFAGMRAPPNLGRDYVASFEAVFDDLAKKHDVVFYPFFLDGVAARPKLLQTDGIHPNGAGVEVIVRRIFSSVETLLERIGEPRHRQSGN